MKKPSKKTISVRVVVPLEVKQWLERESDKHELSLSRFIAIHLESLKKEQEELTSEFATKPLLQRDLAEHFKILGLFSSESLIDFALYALKLLGKRLFLFPHKNPAFAFIDGWDLDRLSEVSCIPPERLIAIAQGDKITDHSEYSGLLRAGMNPQNLKKICKQEELEYEKTES